MGIYGKEIFRIPTYRTFELQTATPPSRLGLFYWISYPYTLLSISRILIRDMKFKVVLL